jgi:hypothetical protein
MQGLRRLIRSSNVLQPPEKSKIMKTINLAFSLGVVVAVSQSLLQAEELNLKPLEPIVAEFTKSKSPDLNEFAYVSARGAALFLALSAYIEANPRPDGADKQFVTNFKEKGMAYFLVAVIVGKKFSKTDEATVEQVQILLETYAKMIVASKQLNNEIVSPAIRKDIEALKQIEALVLEMAADFEKKSSKAPSK